MNVCIEGCESNNHAGIADKDVNASAPGLSWKWKI
jgi:hypothetical protein